MPQHHYCTRVNSLAELPLAQPHASARRPSEQAHTRNFFFWAARSWASPGVVRGCSSRALRHTAPHPVDCRRGSSKARHKPPPPPHQRCPAHTRSTTRGSRPCRAPEATRGRGRRSHLPRPRCEWRGCLELPRRASLGGSVRASLFVLPLVRARSNALGVGFALLFLLAPAITRARRAQGQVGGWVGGWVGGGRVSGEGASRAFAVCARGWRRRRRNGGAKRVCASRVRQSAPVDARHERGAPHAQAHKRNQQARHAEQCTLPSASNLCQRLPTLANKRRFLPFLCLLAGRRRGGSPPNNLVNKRGGFSHKGEGAVRLRERQAPADTRRRGESGN
jgi:hypothetical protein